MFRRKFRRGSFRRRRRLPETYTVLQCFQCTNVYQDAPCNASLIDIFPLMLMSTPRNVTDTTEVTNPSDQYVVVDAIKFQTEHSHDPAETRSHTTCDPVAFDVSFLLRIWEAIVLLPLAQGTSNVPAYLPDLTSPTLQAGDYADRVLWKRLSILPIWGLNVTNQFPQLETTIRDVGHGPVVAKSKCRIDDRHGLFFVRNFFHDVVFGNPGETNCIDNAVTNPCVIPIQLDAIFKVFYHSRK